MSSDAIYADDVAGSRPASKPERISVLAVVDQDTDATLIKDVLTGQGYTLYDASSADEALLCLLRRPIDVVLIDLQMPGTSGLEVASLIRSRERNRWTPIILLLDSTLAPATGRQAALLGMTALLERPLEPYSLSLAVAHMADLSPTARSDGVSRFSNQLRQVQTEAQMTMTVLTAERRYRKLAETVPLIVWTAGPDGTIDYLNHHWIDYTGVNPSQVRNGFARVLHPDDADRVQTLWDRQTAMGREFQSNCRLRRHDGVYRWHLLRMVPEWGATSEIVAWYGVLTDIDDIRQHQAALAAFKGTLDMVVDAVWLFDANAERVLYANQGAVALLGFTWNEYQQLAPSALAANTDLLREVAVRPLGRTLETTLRRKDGTVVPVDLSIQYAEVAEGRIIAIARDITERKRAEAERERLYREAVHALKLRDEFLSLASHELRTPLTPIRLHLDRLERRLLKHGDEKEPCPEEVLAGIRTAIRQTERLTKLVGDLLDVSRIIGGRLILRRERTDLAAMARDLIGQFQSEIDRSGSTVTVTAPDSVIGEWDPARLEQIIANLLSNAIKYGAGKPITITVEQDDGFAVLKVQDRGAGIAPEDQERIFQKFERAISPTKATGLGLGLYIARQIAEAHAGTLLVCSQPPEGATFVLRLPKIAPPPVTDIVEEALSPVRPDEGMDDADGGE